jgi:hypothetical protein
MGLLKANSCWLKTGQIVEHLTEMIADDPKS